MSTWLLWRGIQIHDPVQRSSCTKHATSEAVLHLWPLCDESFVTSSELDRILDDLSVSIPQRLNPK